MSGKGDKSENRNIIHMHHQRDLGYENDESDESIEKGKGSEGVKREMIFE